ncbi:MAG: hypothetical protein K6E51_05235 [Treponema sp.]|nr:hypothetical protein [Treponema sp.]
MNKIKVIVFSFLALLVCFSLFCFLVDKLIGHNYAIRDRLDSLKKNEKIADYENFFWEYDFKNIASFDIKFSNGKNGHFNYAKLVDGKIKFESMGGYDGYGIRGYTKYKDDSGVTDWCGYYKLFNFYTVEDVIENLSVIDKVIEEMPVINDYSPTDIFKEDFLQKLPDKVRYEDDEVEVIFYRVKSRN